MAECSGRGMKRQRSRGSIDRTSSRSQHPAEIPEWALQLCDGRPTLRIGSELYRSSSADLVSPHRLGHGLSGVVERREHQPSGTEIAVKRIPLMTCQRRQHRAYRDLEIMKLAKSDYIVQFYGAIFALRERELWICMELMDCSLLQLYKKAFRHGMDMPEDVLSQVIFHTLLGLKYLKDLHNIIHRDVKPSNILLTAKGNGQVKLCDFGHCAYLRHGQTYSTVGTTAYMSPERILPGEVGEIVGPEEGGISTGLPRRRRTSSSSVEPPSRRTSSSSSATNVHRPLSRQASSNSDVYGPPSRQVSSSSDVYGPPSRQASSSSDVYGPPSRRASSSSATGVFRQPSTRTSSSSDVYGPLSRQASSSSDVFGPLSRRASSCSATGVFRPRTSSISDVYGPLSRQASSSSDVFGPLTTRTSSSSSGVHGPPSRRASNTSATGVFGPPSTRTSSSNNATDAYRAPFRRTSGSSAMDVTGPPSTRTSSSSSAADVYKPPFRRTRSSGAMDVNGPPSTRTSSSSATDVNGPPSTPTSSSSNATGVYKPPLRRTRSSGAMDVYRPPITRTRSSSSATDAYGPPSRQTSPSNARDGLRSRRSSFDIRADVWSLGITIVEASMGRCPYDENAGRQEVMRQIVVMPPPRLDDTIYTTTMCDFVARCLTKDVVQRPTFDELLQHILIFRECLKNPNSRNMDVKNILTHIIEEHGPIV